MICKATTIVSGAASSVEVWHAWTKAIEGVWPDILKNVYVISIGEVCTSADVESGAIEQITILIIGANDKMPVFGNTNYCECLRFGSVSLKRPAFDVFAALIIHARLSSIDVTSIYYARRQNVVVILPWGLRMTKAIVDLFRRRVWRTRPRFRIERVDVIGW